MTGKNEDIDALVKELDHIGREPDDTDALNDFATLHSLQAVELLEELRLWREKEEKRGESAQRLVIEGYSEKDMHEAFSEAMAKAMHFLSELHDTSINVIGLMELAHGGHRATLEVLITPQTNTRTAHLAGQDVELKRINERAYRKRKHHEETHLKELFIGCFLEKSGLTPDVPDYLLININDSAILNMMIEKDFFEVTHDGELSAPETAVVRINKPDNRSGPKEE